MIYKAYLKQDDNGCDYTIGCAQTVITIEASNIETAERELVKVIKENYYDETELKSCVLYEINQEVEISTHTVYKRIREEKEKKEKRDKLELDREIYEKLKERFGD